MCVYIHYPAHSGFFRRDAGTTRLPKNCGSSLAPIEKASHGQLGILAYRPTPTAKPHWGPSDRHDGPGDVTGLIGRLPPGNPEGEAQATRGASWVRGSQSDLRESWEPLARAEPTASWCRYCKLLCRHALCALGVAAPSHPSP